MIGRSLDDGDLRKLRQMLDQEEAACAIGATGDGHSSAKWANNDPAVNPSMRGARAPPREESDCSRNFWNGGSARETSPPGVPNIHDIKNALIDPVDPLKQLHRGSGRPATNSTAEFECNRRRMTKPEGTSTPRREVYDSTADERTAIVYPDDDRAAVADICYTNHCSERKSSMCGG
jgi:hypothetical protein